VNWQEFISSTQGIITIVAIVIVIFVVALVVVRLKTKQKRLSVSYLTMRNKF
jgi:hypothetical protein